MPSTLRPREITILEQFALFPYLTAEQVIKLGIYAYGSRQAVRDKLKHFTDERYLLRDTPYKDTQAGSVAFVYWLSAIGRHFLVNELGYAFDHWRLPSAMREYIKSSHFPHTLGVTDFLIAALRVTTLDPRIQIDRVIHDLLLKSQMQGAPVIPDGLIKFASGEQPVIWVEYDRQTEKEVAFKEKIHRLVTFIGQGFADWFDTPFEHFTFAFVTPFGEHRVRDMLRWTQAQLTAMQQPQIGQQLLFASLPETYDSSVFVTPHWHVPFRSEKYQLVEL